VVLLLVVLLGLGGTCGVAIWRYLGADQYVFERWPNGTTPAIRTAVEEFLPPPDTAEWEDVQRWGGDKISFYRECVFYQTARPPREIVTYYAELLWAHGLPFSPTSPVSHVSADPPSICR
jgi:hypothetical protein